MNSSYYPEILWVVKSLHFDVFYDGKYVLGNNILEAF